MNLNDFAFILQKRGTDFKKSLLTMIKNNEEEKMKKLVSSFITMALHRSEQLILNKDYLLKNFGVIDSRPVEIDIGNFYYDHAMRGDYIFKRESVSFISPLVQFFEKRHFDMAIFTQEELSRQIEAMKKR